MGASTNASGRRILILECPPGYSRTLRVSHIG